MVTVFSNCNIMSGTYKRLGGDGKGGQPEVSYTFNGNTGSSVVSSINDRSRYNPQDKWSVVGSSLAPLTSLLMPFTGSTGPVMYLHGLTGSVKTIHESTHGHLQSYAWYA